MGGAPEAVAADADRSRTAVGRFERVVGRLPYAAITDEHARRFKADLLADDGLKNATRQKLWGMLRALLNVAVDDGLLDANPFSRVKLRLDDDSAAREVLTRQDLAALFGSARDEEEWWLFRIGLYTGARLGEICQLTKADLVTLDGVPFLHIREDAETGKRVKNRGSVRKVPLHRQLIADGILEWIAAREGDALFTMASPVASKRLNRRMRAAGLGPDKPFHALRHTFKSPRGASWARSGMTGSPAMRTGRWARPTASTTSHAQGEDRPHRVRRRDTAASRPERSAT